MSGTGTVTLPNTDGHTADASLVKSTAHFGAANGTAGTLNMTLYCLISSVVAAADVRNGVARYSGGSSGTAYIPAASDVRYATTSMRQRARPTSRQPVWYSLETTWTPQWEPMSRRVQAGYSALAPGYGAAGATSGTLAASKIHDATYGTLADGSVLVAADGTYVDPANSDVWHGVAIGVSPRVGTKQGSSITNLTAANLASGVTVDNVGPGTFAHTSDYELITTAIPASLRNSRRIKTQCSHRPRTSFPTIDSVASRHV